MFRRLTVVLQIQFSPKISKRSYCGSHSSLIQRPRPRASHVEHCHSREIVKSNWKITSYIRCGDLNSALAIFWSMKARSTVTWNSILVGLSTKPGMLKEARDLFDGIPQRDTVSYNIMLSCYFRNADVNSAMDLFDRMPAKDAASWNTMISGLSRNGKMLDAMEFFRIMPEKNDVTWNAMISGYADKGDMDMALELLEKAPVKSPVAWTSIITGHMRRGEVGPAERAFCRAEKNMVTWNAMIAGYVLNGREEDGLRLFKKMAGFMSWANSSGFSSLLLACSNLSLLKLGKQFHQLACKLPLYASPTIGTSLISMYCKCGVVEDGGKLFLEMPRKDVVSWNAMISGYAQHGMSQEALDLFDEMREKGMKPDWITFVGVLSACNHVGSVELGISYFKKMQSDYAITARPDHYTCVIDLLGRAGRFDKANDLIKKMPFEPHAAVYGTLLGACRVHKNVEMAELAAEKLLSLEPHNTSAYVQLANVYAVSKRWESMSRVRKSMKEMRAVKTPGYSWIEVGGSVHEFRSGDRVHPELGYIHEKLDELERKIRVVGYVPDLESALHDVGEEQKVKLLMRHSEKLAIAFGLMRVGSGLPITVFKNLRVCDDCHLAIKYMSGMEGREMIVRDTARFHHFKDGKCSCGDYW